MMFEAVINLIIWIYQHTLLAILPEDFSFFPYSVFVENLNSTKEVILNVFGYLSAFFPIDFMITTIYAILVLELILFGVKGAMYAINLVRGAGA